MPGEAPEYVLGTHAQELQRLGFQHRLWSASAHSLWQHAGIKPGMSVLDIGCGPGFASLDLAQIVGEQGLVVGLDESDPFIEFARAQAQARYLDHAWFHSGDAGDCEALLIDAGHSPGTFDLVYLRWVLCFVPNPERVIRAVHAMLSPGGKLCVQDYFKYESMALAPRSDAFESVIGAIAKSWRDPGGDPDIMGRLPSIAAETGFEVEHVGRVETESPRPSSTMWQWPATFWPVFLPRLESLGYITPEQHEQFLKDWDARSSDPSAFMHLPPVYEMIAVKR